jgi:hypothetical protein
MNRRDFIRNTVIGASAASFRGSSLLASPVTSVSTERVSGQVAPRGWSYYAADEFELDVLRPRWAINNSDVSVHGGMVQLQNRNDRDGLLELKGLYKVSEPRIFLQWPWTMETRMIAPQTTDSAYNVGVLITVSDGHGWKANIELGRTGAFGSQCVFYNVEGHAAGVYSQWEGNALDKENDLKLRVEGVGNDQKTVRMGVARASGGAWIWSPPIAMSHRVAWAQPMALRNGRVFQVGPNGDIVNVAFDYVRFEGQAFQPGSYDTKDSRDLDNLSEEQRNEMKRAGLSVDYQRPKVTPVLWSLPAGKRYQVRVPDTLDMAARLALSLNVLTSAVDPGADCEPYCHVFANPMGWNNYTAQYNPDIERRAPVMTHDFHGYNTGIGEGWIEDMPFLRTASGSTQNLEVSQQMFDNMRRMIGDDGLPRFPLRGRPWALFVGWWIDDPVTGRSSDTDLTMTGEFAWGRFLSSLAAWYTTTGNPALREEVEKMVVAFGQLYEAHPEARATSPMEYALVQVYRKMKFEPARQLAYRMLQSTRTQRFHEDGSFDGHFHDTSFRILAMAQLAVACGDPELLEFSRKAYEFARGKGSRTVGFYPETTRQNPQVQETCALTHMPGIAAILSNAGVGDYWDDVDRMARNQLVENQLTDSEWLYKMAAEIPDYHTPTPANYDGLRNVGPRLLGSFAGFASANDYFTPVSHAPGPMVGCCTGNGARALYYVWKNIVREKEGRLKVNLLLNRASRWADVDSYIPYEGRVDIHMKTTEELFVRIPEWVQPDQVRFEIGKKNIPLMWSGRYASPGKVAGGHSVVVRFPIAETTVRERIGSLDVSLVLRGSTVVAISPGGKYRPLYQRAYYRAGVTRWKEVERWIAPEELEW